MAEMSEEMKVIIDLFGFLRAMAEAQGLEPEKIEGEWTMKKRKKSSRTTKEISYTPDFEKFWTTYPKRKPSPNKAEAYAKWKQRVKEGQYAEDMIKGAERYAKCIRAEGKEHTGFVKQPSTFLGHMRHYLSDWDLPNQPVTKEEKVEKLEEIKKQKWAVIPATLNPMELTVWANDHQYEPLKNIRPGSAGLEDIREWKITTSKVIKQRIADSLRG